MVPKNYPVLGHASAQPPFYTQTRKRNSSPWRRKPRMATLARTAQSNAPWGLVLISGIFSALIGLFLLSWPGVSLVAIVQLVGLFWLVDGILHLVGIFSDSRQWGWKLMGGVFGVIAGLVVLQHPLLSALLVPALLTSLLGVVGLLIGAIGLAIGLTGGGWGPAV